jgi:hypothetical protein
MSATLSRYAELTQGQIDYLASRSWSLQAQARVAAGYDPCHLAAAKLHEEVTENQRRDRRDEYAS